MRSLVKILLASVALGGILAGGAAHAQTACTVLSQSQLLVSFSDNTPPAGITPQTMRNFVCSTLINPTGAFSVNSIGSITAANVTASLGVIDAALFQASVQLGITAQGNSQATAYDLTTQSGGQYNFVSTTPSGAGIALSANTPIGSELTIYNLGSNILKVYPPIPTPPTQTINGLTSINVSTLTGYATILHESASDWRIVSADASTSGGVTSWNGRAGAVTSTLADTASVLYPGSLVNGDIPSFSGTAGQLVDSGVPSTALTPVSAATANLNAFGNATGGTHAPAMTPFGTFLDQQFAATQGTVAYRSASAWTALTPGTLGQALVTGGTGANPSWTAPKRQIGLALSWVGVPGNSQIAQVTLPFSCLTKANMVSSQGWATTAATTAETIAISYIHSGASTAIGNVTFGTSHTPTFGSASAISLVAGDTVVGTSQSSADATWADGTLTIYCENN